MCRNWAEEKWRGRWIRWICVVEISVEMKDETNHLRARSPFTPRDIFCQRRMSSMESADYPHMEILIDLTDERPTIMTGGCCAPQSMGAIASVLEKRNCAGVAVISAVRIWAALF